MATGTAFADVIANQILDLLLRNTAYVANSSSRFIGLFLTLPNAAGVGGVEPVVGSYARLEVAGATGRAFSVGATATSDNDEDWTFIEATATWGLILGVGIFEELTAGDLILHGALDSNIQIDSGEIFQFDAGDLNVTLD